MGLPLGAVSFTPPSASGSTQAASCAQPRQLELWGLRLQGIHCLGKRRVLGLTISRNPCVWPPCLQHFSTAHLLRLPPACAGGSTCIMLQVLPPSAPSGFFHFVEKKIVHLEGIYIPGAAGISSGCTQRQHQQMQSLGLQKKASEIYSPLFQAPLAPWGCCCAQGGDTGFTPSSWLHQGNALSVPDIWGRKMKPGWSGRSCEATHT